MPEHCAWSLCFACDGEGNVMVENVRKKKEQMEVCGKCKGRGLQKVENKAVEEERQRASSHGRRVLIVGGGLSAMALALALEQRGIDWLIMERDASVESRKQGYGLTLQQGSTALRQLGVELHGVSPTRNVSISAQDGHILGEYSRPETMKRARSSRRPANVVAPRQRVRSAIAHSLLQLPKSKERVLWNCKFLGFCEKEASEEVVLFEIDGKISQTTAWLVVGADGARSSVRRALEANAESEENEHEFINLMVALGICPAAAAPEELRGATWQALDGENRIYVMPFDGVSKDAPYASTEEFSDSKQRDESISARIMWQLSWPCLIGDKDCTSSTLNSQHLVRSICLKKLQSWHSPGPELIKATAPTDITAYPVISANTIVPKPCKHRRIILIGDARGAMTPFKGQGANQALLDAISLARHLRRALTPNSLMSLEDALDAFSRDCIQRVTPKLIQSRENAHILHSPAAVVHGNCSRADAARATFLNASKDAGADANEALP